MKLFRSINNFGNLIMFPSSSLIDTDSKNKINYNTFTVQESATLVTHCHKSMGKVYE